MNPREDAKQIGTIPNLKTGYGLLSIGVDWANIGTNPNKGVNVSLQITGATDTNSYGYTDLIVFAAYPLDYDTASSYTQTFNLQSGNASGLPISVLTVSNNTLSFTIVPPQDPTAMAPTMPFWTFLWGGYQGPSSGTVPPTPIQPANLFLQDFSDPTVTLNFNFANQTPTLVPKNKNTQNWQWKDAGV